MDHVTFVTSDINNSHRRSEDTSQVRLFKSGKNGNFILRENGHNVVV